MTARRNYGSGSVYQRSDGRWFGVVEAGYTKSGKRRRMTVSAATERAAKRKLRDLTVRLERDGVTGADSRTTVKAYADTWLERVAKTQRPQTLSKTRTALNAWVVPSIGHRRLGDLEPDDIRAVSRAMERGGLKPNSARRYQAALTGMLKAAMVDGHPVPPRVLMTEKAATGVSDRRAMTTSEALLVLRAASELPSGSRWALALLQGMRQGEALGLTWDAVDLVNGTLRIEWQLQPQPYRDNRNKAAGFLLPDGYEARHLEGAFHLVRPKSKSGYRVIPLVPWAANALETWRDVAPANGHGLVWPTLDGRPIKAPDDKAEWRAIQAAAGVAHPAGRPYHVHEARHSTATLLMELGVSESVRVAIMGHSSITTTQGYEHVDTATARAALEQVAERLRLNLPGGDGAGPPRLDGGP